MILVRNDDSKHSSFENKGEWVENYQDRDRHLCHFPVAYRSLCSSAQTPSSEASLIHNPVYQRNCAKCHGNAATGRHFRGPSLISEKAAAVSSEELRNIISNGKGHMPKFAGKLAPEEIDQLVAQINALNKIKNETESALCDPGIRT
jgi:cytochrome c553